MRSKAGYRTAAFPAATDKPAAPTALPAGVGVIGWVPVVRGPDGDDVPIPWCMGDTQDEARDLYDSLNARHQIDNGHGLPPLLRVGRALITLIDD
jgi:hypothetical protein